MEFKTNAQKACYEKLATWMKELFGEFAMPHPEAPFFGVTVGSALAQTGVYPMGPEDASIATRAYVVTDIETTPELTKYLLLKNNDMRFGGFGMDGDGDIFFQHSIVGSSCDKNELRASVMAVLMTADQLDDEIVSRWGGKRALDKVGAK